MTTFRFLAALAAGLIACAAPAQTIVKASALPAAQPLTGNEGMRSIQGGGCASQLQPCANVLTKPGAIGTYLAPPIAARVPTARQVATSGPLTGGGALSGDLNLGIAAATSSAAGTMSAADKAKLDGIAAGATANTGTVTSVSATGGNGITASVTNAGTTPAIAIGLGTVAIANGGTGATTVAAAQTALGLGSAATYDIGTSGATVGLLNGSNAYSGAMTFSQAITGSVTGNAGTASKWSTARTLSVTGDIGWSMSVDGSGNASAICTLAASGVTPSAYGSATAVPVPTVDAKGRVTSITTAALGSAAAQTYAEGTFTPALQFGGTSTGITYDTGLAPVARCTRIGRLVTVEMQIALTSKGTATGMATIAGLPYTSANVLSLTGVAPLMISGGPGFASAVVVVRGNSNAITLYYSQNGSLGVLDNTAFGNGSYFFLTLTYSV